MKNLGFIRKYDSRRKTIFVFLLISLKNNHTNVKFNNNISCLVTTKVMMIIFLSDFIFTLLALATATYEPPKMNPLTGEKAELVCNLPNVDPGLQVFWSKDGMSFEPNSPRVQFAANGMKIEFSSVIPEDAGSYTCSVNDEVGTSYTTNVNVFPDSKCMYPSHYMYYFYQKRS